MRGYLQNRGLGEWERPLVEGGVARVSQLTEMTAAALQAAAASAGRPLDGAAAERIVQTLRMS